MLCMGHMQTFNVYKLTVMTRKVVIRTFLFTKTNEKDANISLLG